MRTAACASPRYRGGSAELRKSTGRGAPPATDELTRKRVAARSRTGELQDIFASRHSTECEQLQARLALLDAEETNLRTKLASLQQALEEANAERTAEARSTSKSQQPAESAAADSQEGGRRTPQGTESGMPSLSLTIPGRGGEVGPSAEAAEDATGGMQKLNLQDFTKELTNPNADNSVISKRRQEARFREACVVHEDLMGRMKAEYAELERRLRKQRAWMQKVDSQILQAELNKVRYKTRLDKAECRVKSLSADLSQAYDIVVRLLEERMRLEDTKAKNEALIAYLNVLGRNEAKNAKAFTENKAELNTLLECCRQSSICQTQLDALVDDARSKHQVASDLLQRCNRVLFFNRGFNYQWGQIPAAWKETVFRYPEISNQDKSSHPVNAMQTVHEVTTNLAESLTIYLAELGSVLEDPGAVLDPVLAASEMQCRSRGASD